MKTTHIQTHEFPFTTGEVRAGVLDLPRNRTPQLEQNIMFAGWVLRAKEDGAPLQLRLETDQGDHTLELNTDRPSVVSAVLKKDSDARLCCGFRMSVPSFQEGRLYIVTKGEKTLWRTIRCKAEPDSVTIETYNRAIEALVQACEGQGQLDRSLAKHLKKRSVPQLDAILANGIAFTNFAKLQSSISPSERVFFSAFKNALTNPNSLLDWIQTATQEGHIAVPHPFCEGQARSSFSVDIDQRTNLLFFSGPCEPFIIFQHVTFADAVFFPKREIALLIQHMPEPATLRAIAEGLHWVATQKRRAIPSKRVFGGGISGYGRPYHFFYDIVPAFELLDEANLLGSIPKIYCSAGSFFINLPDAFNDPPALETAEPKALRQRVLSHGEFHCHLGLPYSRLDQDLNEKVNKRVRATALEKHPQPETKKTARHLKLWWGIMGQKRSWLEQEEGTAYILDTLLEEWPDLEVVFDGWTSPIDPNGADAREIETDQSIVSRIISQMKHPVKASSVIGKSSLEKVAIGASCDAFVANYATGSMHISRFASRPGVLHLNTKLPKHLHRHYRAVTVPAALTEDALADADKRADFISYSIDPDTILLLLRSVIETHNR